MECLITDATDAKQSPHDGSVTLVGSRQSVRSPGRMLVKDGKILMTDDFMSSSFNKPWLVVRISARRVPDSTSRSAININCVMSKRLTENEN